MFADYFFNSSCCTLRSLNILTKAQRYAGFHDKNTTKELDAMLNIINRPNTNLDKLEC